MNKWLCFIKQAKPDRDSGTCCQFSAFISQRLILREGTGETWKAQLCSALPFYHPTSPCSSSSTFPTKFCVKKAWWVSVSTLLLQRRKCRSWKVTHPIQTRPSKEKPGGDFNPGSPAPAPIRCQLCCAASCLSSEASWTGRSSCEARWSNARPRYQWNDLD